MPAYCCRSLDVGQCHIRALDFLRQLALYYSTLGHHQRAISTLQKALFIDPGSMPATVHLARLYLTLRDTPVDGYSAGVVDGNAGAESHSHSEAVDLACGLLTRVSHGHEWIMGVTRGVVLSQAGEGHWPSMGWSVGRMRGASRWRRC